MHTGFWWGNLKEDPDVDRKKMLEWICEKCAGGTDWIDVTQDRDRWPAFLNAVMNLVFP